MADAIRYGTTTDKEGKNRYFDTELDLPSAKEFGPGLAIVREGAKLKISDGESWYTAASFYTDIADIPVNFDGVAKVGNQLITGDGTNKQKIALRARNPRIVRNIAHATARYPTGSTVSGTATGTASRVENDNGVKAGVLECVSGSAGRAFYTATWTLDADTWYAASFEVTEVSGMTTGTNEGFKLATAGTAVINNTSGNITAEKLAAGGIGRYCVVFRSILGGTTTFRLGVGLNSNVANRGLTFKNLQLEKLTADSNGCAWDYVYPGYSYAFDYRNPWSMDANSKITAATYKKFPVKPFSFPLVIGDSRSNEVNEIPDGLNTSMNTAGIGACAIHAGAGWSSVTHVGPTSFEGANMTGAVSITFDEALAGGKKLFYWSTDGDEQISDNVGMAYDSLFVCCFGFNDVNGDNLAGIATAMTNITAWCNAAEEMGMDVMLGTNNPCKGGTGVSDTELGYVKELNQQLKQFAVSRGYPIVDPWPKMGDSTDPDKLSDGAGTTPDYSNDGLHPNAAGYAVYAAEALAVVQANR